MENSMNDLLTTPHCFALQQGSPTEILAIPYFLIIALSVIVGVCTIVAGAKLQSTYKRGWLIITSGVLRVLFVFPFGMFALMMIVAGVIEIVAAIRLRQHVTGTVFLALAGIASMLFVPLLILGASPSYRLAATAFGGISIFFGACVFGACSLTFGLMMRSSTKRHNE